jgi:hypothetical protein
MTRNSSLNCEYDKLGGMPCTGKEKKSSLQNWLHQDHGYGI